MTDNDIIENLRCNKYRAALKGLYAIYPQVKKYVVLNNGSVADAEDIFQDALVILYKKVNTSGFQLTSSLQSFVMGIARNCWLQELRIRNKVPTGTMINEPADTSTTDESSYHVANTAFQLLGEKCKQILILFYYNKKSFQEIATVMSFSDEHVARNQKYRCLQKAKEHFVSLTKNPTDEQ